MIGTIHLLNKNQVAARDYLIKAQNIFEYKGLLKLLKEVKQKVKLLNPTKMGQMISDPGMSAAQMLAAAGAALDSEEDLSELISPELASKKPKKVVGAKTKKVGASQNKSKKINNFMER